MDVLDGHRNDGYGIIRNQQSDTNSYGEAGLTSEPLDNDQNHQSESSWDNLQCAPRAVDRTVNDFDDALDHHHHQQQQQQHEQKQYGTQECNFMASNEGNRVGHCQQACLFDAGDELSQDDAFVPFCAEAVSTSDPNQKYYTNKLYRPLKNGTNHKQQNQVHNYDQNSHQQYLEGDFHLEEQDDALSMYAELEFMESTSQRTAFNKILEDDDGGDEANLGKDNDDSLENLQLTSLIDSFVEFAASPLANNQNGDELSLPLYPRLASNQAELPDSSQRVSVVGKSSTSSEHQINELNFPSSDSFYQNPTDDQYRHQNLFDSQNYVEQSGACYPTNDVNSTNHQLNGDSIMSSQDYIEKHDRGLSSIEDNNKHSSSLSETQQGTSTNNQIESVNTETIAVNNSEKKRRSCEEEATTIRKQRLKKRRSTMSFAERSKQQTQASPIIDPSDGCNGSAHSLLEDIKELNDCLVNDDDDLSAISDNNSMRSESSRRNPVVSHYRRRTANARERIRMREINQAFEKLKRVVPIELVEQASLESGEVSDQASVRGGRRKSSPSSGSQGDSVKLTKITTLRMAVSYIAKLTEILNQTPEPTSDSSSISELVSRVEANSDQQAEQEETSGKSRLSRSKSRKLTHGTVKSRRKGAKVNSGSKTTEKKIGNDEISKTVGQDNSQHSMIVTNPVQFNQVIEQRNQRPQQPAAFISIPNQQKRQFLASYSNQQLLISQPLGNERLVTPVAVAILGIPNTNSNELIGTQNIQLVGVQKATLFLYFSPAQSFNSSFSACEESRQKQAQQQQPQQQQPVRTYRFHNYDGNMISSHLYGNNNPQTDN